MPPGIARIGSIIGRPYIGYRDGNRGRANRLDTRRGRYPALNRFSGNRFPVVLIRLLIVASTIWSRYCPSSRPVLCPTVDPHRGVRVDQRTKPSAHRGRRPRGRRLEDVRLVRVQQPDRLPPETATRIRTVARALGYRPNPVARMLGQRRRDDRRPDPAGSVGHVREPVLRRVHRGVASRPRRGLRPPVHLAAATASLASAMAGRRSTASWPSASRDDHPEVEQSGGPACRSSRSIRAPCPTCRRSTSTTRAAPTPRPTTSRPRPSRHSSSWASSAAPSAAASPLASAPADARLPRGPRRPRHRLPRRWSSVRDHRGRDRGVRGAWAAGQRPTAVLAMSDAMAIGAIRAPRASSVCASRPTCRSSASTTSNWPAYWIRRSRPSASRSGDKGREAAVLLLSSPARREDRSETRNGSRPTHRPGFDSPAAP